MSLFKNSATVIIGVFVANIIGYISNVYAARVLGPSSYGILGALMALFILITMLIAPLVTIVTNYIADSETNKSESAVLGFIQKTKKDLIFLLVMLLLILMLFSNDISKYLNVESKLLIFLTGLMFFINGLLIFNQSVFAGFKKFKLISYSKIFEALIRSALIVIFVLFGSGVSGIIGANIIALLLVFSWTSSLLPKNNISFNQHKYTFNRYEHYSIGLKFLISGLFVQLILNIPSIYFQHKYSSEVNGFWNAGLYVSRIALLFTDAINQVIFSELLGEQNIQIRKRTALKALGITFAITGSSALILFLFPEFIINFIYGKSYFDAIKFLQWQGVFILMISLFQLYFSFLFSKVFERNKV